MIKIKNLKFLNIIQISDFQFENNLNLIYGKSGCGKSTLFYLINRFLEKDDGEIIIDGINQNNYFIYDLRTKVNLLSANPLLFEDKIIDNFTYLAKIQKIDLDFGKLKYLFKLFNLDVDINQSSQKLSVGQKQRIALIRSLMSKSDILLMDEVLANVDNENAKIILDYLANESKKRMIIIVSHQIDLFDERFRKIEMLKGDLKYVD